MIICTYVYPKININIERHEHADHHMDGELYDQLDNYGIVFIFVVKTDFLEGVEEEAE